MSTQHQQTKPNRKVLDEKGFEYEITGKIGEGGQGIVCSTNHPNILIKVSRKPLTDPRTASWFKHVKWVSRQPLDNLHIARPVAFINHPRNPGYVMQLMDGLEPLQVLLEKAHLALLEGQGLDGFISSGGISRRVRALAKLARILADLHGRALVYGDLSPANIFISQSLQYDEVWLIDSDNISTLCRNISTLQQNGEPPKIWSPDFGAPEIVRNEAGIDSYTDSWSFGVLAFLLMTLIHPLKGDMVSDGDPELEDQALRGALPWVDHPTDKCNSASMGLPRDRVLTLRLRNLFEQCFNSGLNNPEERPSMAEWAEAFDSAVMLLAKCDTEKGCGNSFLFNPRAACPFCDHALPQEHFLLMHHFVCEPIPAEEEHVLLETLAIRTYDRQLVTCNNKVELRSSPAGSSTYNESCLVCSLELNEDGLLITPESPTFVTLSRMTWSDNKPISKPFLLRMKGRIGKFAYLHIGDANAPHAVWRFKW